MTYLCKASREPLFRVSIVLFQYEEQLLSRRGNPYLEDVEALGSKTPFANLKD
jgi:hypothetical protein